MSIKKTKLWKLFSSITLAVILLIAIAIVSAVGTLLPQFDNYYSEWWFIALLAVFSLNLLVCLINRFSLKGRALGTTLCHLSVLVILIGASVGMYFGERSQVRIPEGHTINVADFSVRLDDFIYQENIDPAEHIMVYSKEGELVDEISAEIGTNSAITGSKTSVKVLRYVNDFVMDTNTKEVTSRSAQPRNPAIELEVINDDGVQSFWIFAHYPDMHKATEKEFVYKYHWAGRRPKDFISKVTLIKDGEELWKHDIRVNYPLRFEGYAFFQSTYDQDHLSWTGLQVVKDPGVPLVYAGFLLLILGLIKRFYIK